MNLESIPRYKISYVATKDLIPYANNSRTHSDEQVNQIASSINEFGFTNPVLIDARGNIIAGHGRVMAANKLGLEQVPTIELKGLTKAQIKAYVIADNQLALNASWDLDVLKLEIEHLKEVEFDIDLLGFDDGFLSSLFLDREWGDTDAESEWDGMPEFDQEDDKPFRSIIVHFENEAMVIDFMRIMGQKLTDKTKYIYHPKQVRNDLASQSYE